MANEFFFAILFSKNHKTLYLVKQSSDMLQMEIVQSAESWPERLNDPFIEIHQNMYPPVGALCQGHHQRGLILF